jgi:DNA-binding CsgD family transcriptional regulator
MRADAINCLAAGSAREAVDMAQALVDMDRQGGERIDLGHSLSLLARARILANDEAAAMDALAQLEELLAGHPYPYLKGLANELRGLTLAKAEDFELAFELLSEASDLFETCSNSLDRARCLRLAADVRTKFTGDSADEAVQLLREGRRIAESVGAIVELNRIDAALRSLGVRPRAGRPRGRPPTNARELSPREAEVVALVAAGATNAEIADRLFLSDRTVQDHITHSLRKLQLSGRAGLASWAVKQGML